MEAGVPRELTFAGVLNRAVNWTALNRAAQNRRVRVGATVSRVQRYGPVDSAPYVNVTYAKGERLQRARRVAMATGVVVNKQVVLGMPQHMLEAYTKFVYAPALVANVALINWTLRHRFGIYRGSLV